MKKAIWFGAASGSLGLSIGLLTVDSGRSAGDLQYSFWVCPLAFGAYVAALIALACLTCGIFDIPFPSLGRQPSSPVNRPYLGENRQLSLSENVLSDEDMKDIKAKVRAAANFTEADRNSLLEPYFGRWMEFSGTVINVGAWNWNVSCSIVMVRPDVRGVTAYLTFTDRDVYDKRVRIIMRNKRIAVLGQISSIGLNEMSFVNCQLAS
jgi:hypothetical protein